MPWAKIKSAVAKIATWVVEHRKPISIIASAALSYSNPHLDLVWISDLGNL